MLRQDCSELVFIFIPILYKYVHNHYQQIVVVIKHKHFIMIHNKFFVNWPGMGERNLKQAIIFTYFRSPSQHCFPHFCPLQPHLHHQPHPYRRQRRHSYRFSQSCARSRRPIPPFVRCKLPANARQPQSTTSYLRPNRRWCFLMLRYSRKCSHRCAVLVHLVLAVSVDRVRCEPENEIEIVTKIQQCFLYVHWSNKTQASLAYLFG